MRDLTRYDYIKEEDYQVVAGPDWPSFADFQQHVDVADFIYDEIDTMLSDVKPFSHPTFCVLPFYGWEYPVDKPCCLLPNEYDLDSIRTDMLARVRPSACGKCWRLEDQGIRSDRLIKNETLDFYYRVDLEKLFEQAQAGNHSIVNYKIDTSSVCNATCITCNSYFSSAWAQLERKNGITPLRSWRVTRADVDRVIDYATARSIGFRGGEPLLSDINFYILEQLLEHDNSDCFINFTTNGSLELSDYQKNLISKFKSVNFGFSIDGVGPVFEYLRYPSKWLQLERNINYCRENNIMISASYTVSNLNILYHTETIKWFEDNDIPYLINPVYWPEHFRISALPESIKQHIIDCGLPDNMVEIVQEHTAQDDQDYQVFLEKIAEQDRWKGIGMQDYLPELAALIDHK